MLDVGGIMTGLHQDLHHSAGALAWKFLRGLLDDLEKRTGVLKDERKRVGGNEKDGAWSCQNAWKMRNRWRRMNRWKKRKGCLVI